MPQRDFQEIKKYLFLSDRKFESCRSKSTLYMPQFNEENAEKGDKQDSEKESDVTIDMRELGKDITPNQGHRVQNETLNDILRMQTDESNKQRPQVNQPLEVT